MTNPQRVLPGCLLFLAAVTAGCGKNEPVPEQKAVHDSFETRLMVPDPDLAILIPHAAWLGTEALPPLARVYSLATDVKKRKLARLLGMLAFNGYRTRESVSALSGASREKDAGVRQLAIDALFWSAVDEKDFPGYWDPASPDPAKPPDTARYNRMPFEDCRERLAQLGLEGFKGSDGKLTGEPGKHPEGKPPVPSAKIAISNMFRSETDPRVKLFAAIQTARLGDPAPFQYLVGLLRPPQEGSKSTPEADASRAKALRVLQEVTKHNWTRYEDWSAWLAEELKKHPQPGFTPMPPRPK